MSSAGNAVPESGASDSDSEQNANSATPEAVLEEMKSLDANKYATKKTVAQGMLDIALLTSNASQLKYVLQVGARHEFYTLLLVLISISIVLQVLMGVVLLSLNLLRDCRLHLRRYHASATYINYLTTASAFLVTVLNLMVGLLFVMIGGLNLNEDDDQPSAIILNDVLGAIVAGVLGYIYNINLQPDQRKAVLINDISLGFKGLVLLINLLISIFYSMHIDMNVATLS